MAHGQSMKPENDRKRKEASDERQRINPHPVTTLTIDEIKAITAKYKAMKKEIER